MKLKKIASLMLAGVMAVSMLAACGDNGNSNSGNGETDVTPTSTYTNEVLDEANEVTQLKLTASTNTKLDTAIAYAAANITISQKDTTLTNITSSSHSAVNFMSEYMTGAEFVSQANAVSKLNVKDDVTYYMLYRVSRMQSDEYITKAVASALDDIAADLNNAEDADGNTYSYTVSVAKADVLAGNDADRADDSVLVGVAITLDYTAAEY